MRARSSWRGLKRWLIVALTLGAPLAAVVPMRHYRLDSRARDEILAYELAPDRPVRARVAAGIEEALVTTWALIPPEESWDPARTYQYAYRVDVWPEDGKPTSRQLDVVSRISGDPRQSAATGEFAARLASGGQWVTDARTSVVSLKDIADQGGLIRLSSLSSRYPVLARVLYREPRSAAEQRILARTISESERRRMTSGRSSLGFDDLASEAQTQALSSWGRRLVAEGREGVDYVTRRLLLGEGAWSPVDSMRAHEPTLVGPGRHAAFNFVEPASLRLAGPPGGRLVASSTSGARRELTFDRHGSAGLEVATDGLTTLTLQSLEPLPIHVRVPPDQWAAQLGAEVLEAADDGSLAVMVDDRVQRFWRLDPSRPLVFGVDPDMPYLEIEARGEVRPEQEVAEQKLELRLSFERDGDEEQLEAPARISAFERLRESGHAVTEAQSVRVRPSAQARSLSVTGPDHVLVKVQTREPGVERSVIEAAYDVPVPDGYRLRYAPFFIKTWTNLAPEDHLELQRAGRSASVVTQVRLEADEEAGSAIVPRRAAGEGPMRTLDLPVAAGQWVDLGRGGKLQAEKGILDCLFWVDRALLGQTATVSLLGGARYEKRLMFSSGGWRLPLDDPDVELELDGFGEPHVFICRGSPRSPENQALTRRRVQELDAAPWDFDRRAGELLTLLVFTTSDEGPAPELLRYQIDGGQARTTSTFSSRRTESEGVVSSDQVRPGRLWLPTRTPEVGFTHRWARYRIQLGDDLQVGKHSIKLEAVSGGQPLTRLWGRVVVVGRVEGGQGLSK